MNPNQKAVPLAEQPFVVLRVISLRQVPLKRRVRFCLGERRLAWVNAISLGESAAPLQMAGAGIGRCGNRRARKSDREMPVFSGISLCFWFSELFPHDRERTSGSPRRAVTRRAGDYAQSGRLRTERGRSGCRGHGGRNQTMPVRSKCFSQLSATLATPERHFSSNGLSSPASRSRSVKTRLPPCLVYAM